MNKKEDPRTTRARERYINKRFLNNEGLYYTVIKFNNSTNILIKFDDNTIIKTTSSQILRDSIKNPNNKSVYGIGFFGIGKHKSFEEGKITKKYDSWNGMFQRCYSKKYIEKFPTYRGCSVCEEWHNFQNFGDWFDENYYEVDGERMELDKDILIKGNKIYSPENCMFVPRKINTFLVNRKLHRGKYPLGVRETVDGNKLSVKCNNPITTKEVHIGNFDDEVKAFIAYKEAKTYYLNLLIDYYGDKIPIKLISGLTKYKFEITD